MAMISVTISGNAGPLKKAVGEADQSLGKIGDSFKKVGLAAAAGFGALAAGLGAAVKAAAEDQQSFEQLRQTIQNTTAATDEMVQAVDDQIAAMSMAFGVADDKLRPALANLVRATGDVTMSQEILQVALDISAATGRDLDSVSLALAKAYGGQTTSLQKLGIQLSDTAKDSGDFKVVTDELTALFGGAAQANADTFSGKIDRLKIVFGEAVEQIGSYLLPIMTELAEFILQRAVPAFQRIVDRVGPALREIIKRISDFVRDVAIPVFEAFRGKIEEVTTVVKNNEDAFRNMRAFLQDFVAFIRDRVAPNFDKILGGSLALVATRDIPKLIDGFLKVSSVVSQVGSFIVKMVDATIEAIEILVNGILEGVNFIIRQLNRIPGVNIGEVGSVDFNPERPSTNTPSLPNFLGSPDRLPSPAMQIPSTPSALDVSSGGGGGGGGGRGGRGGLSIDPRALELGGLTLANLADYGNLESARIADLALMGATPSVVNVTINTVTADENLPTMVVDAFQRYNLIYGPAEIEIAV
jgi:phage-related protein